MSRLLLWQIALVIGVAILLPNSFRAQDKANVRPSTDYTKETQAVLSKYCFSCHGAIKPKGRLDLSSRTGQEKPHDWKEIWERLRTRQMPPSSHAQPSAAERERLLAWIERKFAEHKLEGQADPGPLRPRRLNVREYMNTLRDLAVTKSNPLPRRASYTPLKDGRISLYHIYPPPEHPCAYVPRILPTDTNDGGFDTVGENLSIPPFLMGKYLRCSKMLMDDMFSAKGKDENGRYQWSLRELVEKADKGPFKKGTTPRQAQEKLITDFASRAWRRPVTTREIEKYLKLFDLAQDKGEKYDSAIRLPLTAILVSPRSVVLWSDTKKPEKDSAPVRPLDDHELAARLSYFLWSSVPDRELSLLAQQGQLRDPKVLEQQIRRMLKDMRITDGLLEGFLCQWLQLDRLDRALPDADRFPAFFQQNLGELMTREMVLFADAIMVEDRSILEFIDADWGILSFPLAQHYGIDNFPGKKPPSNALPPWYKVKYTDKRRGGVLTMGKVLTGTSQPVRTSPVHRGKWVLETILGTPPPPPPPNVNNDLPEPPKGEKALTVPQLMARHRANPACYSCHQMIDPLGMAFENFDPVGKWRDKDQDQPIDATGTLIDGRKFNGIAELKAVLLERKEDFVRGFVEQMLTYSLGRKLEFYDVATVNAITRATVQDDYRFSRVVIEVAKSYPFRNCRH